MFESLQQKPVCRVVGMMSGTSVDGVDAAVVEIGRKDGAPCVKLLAFENKPYPRPCAGRFSPCSGRKAPPWTKSAT